MRFISRKCDACGLRFPVDAQGGLGQLCPHCTAPTKIVDDAYDSEDARSEDDTAPGVQLEALLDNIRSLTNVGAMFRCADGAGVRHLHLCGFTPTPKHPRLNKTALGAERTVPWTHHPDAVVAAESLLAQGATLWAVEGGPQSESLYSRAPGDLPSSRLVLVFGHEVSGVDPRLLRRCEKVIRLPMLGIKGSLNVSVAFGIVVYHLAFSPPRRAGLDHAPS